MRLNHLALAVRDERKARAFYETFFGFRPESVRRYEDGTLILFNTDGFALALHPGHDALEQPGFLHFGFELPNADQVRTLKAQLRRADVVMVEEYDEPGYVAFKCLDPDGYRVEVYWEPV